MTRHEIDANAANRLSLEVSHSIDGVGGRMEKVGLLVYNITIILVNYQHGIYCSANSSTIPNNVLLR